MKLLDSKLLEKFLKLAGDRLTGDWILIGGTVLPLLGMEIRVTTDIDLLPFGKKDSHSVILVLMRIAEELDLPIETVNQAGLYFLEKIPDYQKHLIVLRRGKNATIYRPDVNLFLRLKMERMTDSDLSDCLAFLKYAKKMGEKIESKNLFQVLDRVLAHSKKTEMRTLRLEKLRQEIERTRG